MPISSIAWLTSAIFLAKTGSNCLTSKTSLTEVEEASSWSSWDLTTTADFSLSLLLLLELLLLLLSLDAELAPSYGDPFSLNSCDLVGSEFMVAGTQINDEDGYEAGRIVISHFETSSSSVVYITLNPDSPPNVRLSAPPLVTLPPDRIYNSYSRNVAHVDLKMCDALLEKSRLRHGNGIISEQPHRQSAATAYSVAYNNLQGANSCCQSIARLAVGFRCVVMAFATL